MVVYSLEQRWEILRQIDLQKMPILAKKNHLFRWNLFWSWRACKQAKLLHLGLRKAARIHWKADAPKTRHCLVRILVQRHNWAIFFENEQGEAVTVNGDRYWAMLNEFLFTKIHKNWQQLVSTGWRQVPHSPSYTRCFASCFCRSHYQLQSWIICWIFVKPLVKYSCTQSTMCLKIGPIV